MFGGVFKQQNQKLDDEKFFSFDEDYDEKREKSEFFDFPAKDFFEQDGDGYLENGDGLYNSELMRLANELGLINLNFVGVFSFDEIDKAIDVIKKRKIPIFSIIINTSWNDEKDNEILKHWCALYCDGISFCYYDSLALNQRYDEIKLSFSPLLAYMYKNYLKYKINNVRHQNINSSHCGFYSIRFLMLMYSGAWFKEATINMNEKTINKFKNILIDTFKFI